MRSVFPAAYRTTCTSSSRLPLRFLRKPAGALSSCSSTRLHDPISNGSVTSVTSQLRFSSSNDDFDVPPLPKSPQQLHAEATKHFEELRYEDAARLWREIINRTDERWRQGVNQTANEKMSLIFPLNNLACAVGELGETDEKLALLTRALDVIADVYGKEHQQYAIALYNLAQTYSDLGDPEKMKSYLLEALEIQEKKFGPNHAKVARVLMLLTEAYGMLGDSQAQLEAAERSVPIVTRHCGPQHQQTCLALLGLASAHGSTGNYSQQVAITQQVLATQEATMGPYHPQLAITLIQLARAHGNTGNAELKKELLERAIEAQKRAFGTEHLKLVETYTAYAEAHGELDDVLGQRRWFGEALRLARTKHGRRHLQTGLALANVCQASLTADNPAYAAKEATEAIKVLAEVNATTHPAYVKAQQVLQAAAKKVQAG